MVLDRYATDFLGEVHCVVSFEKFRYCLSAAVSEGHVGSCIGGGRVGRGCKRCPRRNAGGPFMCYGGLLADKSLH